MMDKYKLQMKALKKQRGKVDNTPFLPEGGVVYILDSMNPEMPVRAEVLKTTEVNRRKVISEVACPLCGASMSWNPSWEGFECREHDRKTVYEILKTG
ncbi:MAG: hypothetical protein CVT48_05835 [Thermoplasmata archaeon HGW-Thermoplasmata-1]|nr:MAG: hypothetical protein CVT48_05835 [Thermoplasmata archaeon HGW-Thermoplasmata-1]